MEEFSTTSEWWLSSLLVVVIDSNWIVKREEWERQRDHCYCYCVGSVNKVIMMFLVLILLLSTIASGLIHNLRVENDDRSIFRIESYGFFNNGTTTTTTSSSSLINTYTNVLRKCNIKNSWYVY